MPRAGATLPLVSDDPTQPPPDHDGARYAYVDVHAVPLPPGHRFPMEKYRRAREILLAEGTLRPTQLSVPSLCPRETLERVHRTDYVDRVLRGDLDAAEVRRIGFPWSPALVRRSRSSVGGTLAAARSALREGIGGSFAGGTHHAYAERGEGFCLFNDVAVTTRELQASGLARRVAIVDCDVHQGNGTAAIFRGDASVFTLSLHGRNNWPFEKETSSMDIALEDGCGDDEYLGRLAEGLDAVLAFGPDLILYIAGVDVLESDRLGRLSLSRAGLVRREEAVLSLAHAQGTPIAVVFGGGYSEDVDAVADAHAEVIRVAEGLFTGGGAG